MDAVGMGLTGCELLCAAGPGAYAGHVVRTLVLGLVANGFDVASDIFNALNYFESKIVTRTIETNGSHPLALPLGEQCTVECGGGGGAGECRGGGGGGGGIGIGGGLNMSQSYNCQVTDDWWGLLTLATIQVLVSNKLVSRVQQVNWKMTFFPQIPGVVLFLCTSFALLLTLCMVVSEQSCC